MSDRVSRLAILTMAATFHMASAAAPNALGTWRCANNTYTDQPCADGQAIDATDTRGDADRRAADAATRRAKAAADAQEKERVKREERAWREGRPAVIARPAPEVVASRPMVKPARKKKGGKEPEFFTAHDPQAAGAGRKRH